MKRKFFLILFFFVISSFPILTAEAQTNTFTFQGKLTDQGNPANGSYQMQFKMFDALTGGNQIGSTVSDINVTVAEGIFTTRLDFGVNAFPGADRFLEIHVRKNSNESFAALNPRQQISSSPYSIKAISAAQADVALDAQKLGGVEANKYVTNTSAPSNLIQNTSAPQNANFNITGNGTVGGNLGIGTSNPQMSMHLLKPWAQFRLQSTQSDVWTEMNFKSTTREWNLGIGGSTVFNEVKNKFYIRDHTVGAERLTITDTGNVGIGTNFPVSRMDIRGNLTLETGANPVLYTGTAAFEQNRYLLLINSINSQTASGLKSGGLLVAENYDYANPGKNDLVVKGNAFQGLNSNGFVKAMIFVLANGTISRCYNGVTGATTGNCGFSVAAAGGIYNVNFGFNVNDRFFSISSFGNTSVPITGRIQGFFSNTTVVARFFDTSSNGSIPSDFYLIVY